jgi:hypothetical protein
MTATPALVPPSERPVPRWARVLSVLVLIVATLGGGASLLSVGEAVWQRDVTGPSAPLVSPVAASENDPGWDCRTQGNRWCGAGVEGGPLVDAGSGWVSCPRGGELYDETTGDVAPGVTPPGEICRYDTPAKIFTVGGDFR